MIKLDAVSLQFSDVVALHPTNLAVHRGQFTVQLGASGAGKSSLLRCLNLMHKPQPPGAAYFRCRGRSRKSRCTAWIALACCIKPCRALTN